MSQHPLTGGEVDVGGDEAANLGVVVSALQVIKPGFGWTYICTRQPQRAIARSLFSLLFLFQISSAVPMKR